MKKPLIVCNSTHGGAGYAEGTYVEKKRLYCGCCKQDITDAISKIASVYKEYSPFENFIKWFRGERKIIRWRKMTKKEKFARLPKWIEFKKK